MKETTSIHDFQHDETKQLLIDACWDKLRFASPEQLRACLLDLCEHVCLHEMGLRNAEEIATESVQIIAALLESNPKSFWNEPASTKCEH